ncbi:MAG: hypothetical protein BRC27_01280 [Nanohaloarchaea archaeon SW_10_44_10]|nr:MAG: hypothetical protein BRC27_01280 [Nanohaloarchaea archaeon SW_10_44_10]
MNNKKFHEYIYDVENWLDELVIAFLSFGVIIVLVDLLLFQSQNYSFITLGDAIFPWITMVALMIIGRELWLLNRNVREHLERTGE